MYPILHRHSLLRFALGVVIGAALFHRDWSTLFTHETFFTEDYYEFYWVAYKLSCAAAFLLTLILGGSFLHFGIGLVAPSLLLRHGQFLAEVGATNLWPPALALDVAFASFIVVLCWFANWVRSRARTRFNGNT
jgi:hypothetical protein